MSRKNSCRAGSAPSRKAVEWFGALRGSEFYPDYSSAPPPLTLDEVKRLFGPPMTLGAPEKVRMACDSQLADSGIYTLLQHSYNLGMMPVTQFMGYGALQNLAQNGLIRACVSTVADDMTRAWIKLKRDGEARLPESNTAGQAPGDQVNEALEILRKLGLAASRSPGADDKDELLERLKAEIDRLGLRQALHKAVETTGYEGGALIFIDTGAQPEELITPLHIGPASAELASDRPLRFVVLDPVNVFPGLYNSDNPLRSDYLNPKTWWVLGREVHASRLLRIVSNEAPTLLKPAYNFLGVPQAQILWDYVLHFQECRLASQRLLTKFSLTVFKTQMFNGGAFGVQEAANMDRRIKYFVQNRNNDGVQVIDKESEDIVKLETPLSGVTDIARQALEFLAAINRTPAVKLLGISPSGFNATGESDLRNYYDHIRSSQEKVLRPALEKILKILQIRLVGECDPSLTFDFAELGEADEAAIAGVQKTLADTRAVYLDRNTVSREEVRRALAADPNSGFENIDVDEMPAEPEPEEPFEGPDSPAGNVDIDDVDKAGAVYDGLKGLDENIWRTAKNGKRFQIDTETGEVVKGNVGQENFTYKSTPLESSRPDTAHYNSLLEKHNGDAKKAAHEYFKDRLQGRDVEAQTDAGPVRACFTGGTWQEIKQDMHKDMLKAELVPHMPDIIATGEYQKSSLYKKRTDNVDVYHVYRKTVQTSEGAKDVFVDVAERVNHEPSQPKHQVYSVAREGTNNYDKKKKALTGDSGSFLRAVRAISGLLFPPSSPDTEDGGEATTQRKNNILPQFEVVNLRFAGEEAGSGF